MFRKGNCWDNVVAERFFKMLKVIRFPRSYLTRNEAKIDLYQYLEGCIIQEEFKNKQTKV